MRKLSVIVAISLLNVALLANCYHFYSSDGKVPAQVSGRVESGGLLVANSESGNQLIETPDNVGLENILASNKDLQQQQKQQQLTTSDYQPAAACQLVQIVHLLQHPGCQPRAIASLACSGSCTSFVRVSVVTDLCLQATGCHRTDTHLTV